MLIETLRIKIARLRRQRFGKSSEKLAGEIEQLQLALEDLEIDTAALLDAGDHNDDKPTETKPATALSIEGRSEAVAAGQPCASNWAARHSRLRRPSSTTKTRTGTDT